MYSTLGSVRASSRDPALSAWFREARRKYREELERRASTDPYSAAQLSAARTDDLRRVEQAGQPGQRYTEVPPLSVRWLSAPPMRDALIRSKQLAGKAAGDSIPLFLSLSERFHVLGLGDYKWVEVGTPLEIKAVGSEPRKELLASAYLELYPGKKKLYPVSVVYYSFGLLEPDLLLLFSREVEHQPTIVPTDTRATFHCTYSAARIYTREGQFKVEFNLEKMRVAGRPEL